MTPLLGTKTSSAPIGDVPAGDERAARATAFKVFHETRDTKHSYCLARRASQREFQGFHETRITAFMLPYPRFPTISRHFPRFPGPPTPLGKGPRAVRSLLSCALWRSIGRLWRGMGGRRPPRRQHGRLAFHQPRISQHVFLLSSGDSNESNPNPGQRVFTNHGLYAFLAAFLQVVERHGAAMARHGRHIVPEPASARAVRCEIPAMCTKSRFPQENARSAAFAAASFALGAQPAEVDANGRTAPASAAKSPLILVDSCPFVVNESMLRKANILYCIDRLFDKRAPAGSRGFRGECRAGWSGRASSLERKSHVPR